MGQPQFIDSKVGDYHDISRIVLNFTDKVSYQIKTNASDLIISFAKESYDKKNPIHLQSENIVSYRAAVDGQVTKLHIKFKFPIEANNFSFSSDNNLFKIVCDVYDSNYKLYKEKELARVLYLYQKFSLKRATSAIKELANKYPNDALCNLYFGEIHAKEKHKQSALRHYKAIPKSSTFYASAQKRVKQLNNNRYPTADITADFLTFKTEDTQEAVTQTKPEESFPKPVLIDTLIQTTQDTVVTTSTKPIADSVKAINSFEEKSIKTEPKKEETAQLKAKPYIPVYIFIIIAISLITNAIIVTFYLKSKKQKLLLNEELEQKTSELHSIKKSLNKGVISNNDTQSRIVLKLYKNGWKASEIAKELSTNIDNVNNIIGSVE